MRKRLLRDASIVCWSRHIPTEIILVDDGSFDATGVMCDAFVIKRQNIRVIHKENGGQATARNLGIKNAHGEFVTFVDPDDIVSIAELTSS